MKGSTSSPARRAAQATAYAAAPSTSAALDYGSPSTSAHSPASVDLFRSLVFDGSISLCVALASDELPAGSDRSIETLWLQVHRITYLPLLIPEIRRNLLELVLDENELALLKEDQLWFECQGEPLKWHWPIGLIYDYLQCNNLLASPAPSSASPYFQTPLSRGPPSASSTSPPFRITLHLRSPPTEKLLLSPSIESCKTNFMNQLKEADFVRWGSVRRVTGLRRTDQDALWDGVIGHDFHKFWSVASKLVPSPSNSDAQRSHASPILSTTSTLDASTGPGARLPDSNAMRSVPMRIYLPHGRPVIQDVVPAVSAAGQRPQTLETALRTLLPLLFPKPDALAVVTDMTQSFTAERIPTEGKRLVRRVVIQGIDVPLDAELGWLSSCLAGADGWLAVIIGV